MIYCRAYNDSQEICMKPAEYLDEQRGCYVCEEHKPIDQENPHPKITRADLQTTGEKIPFFRRRKLNQ